MERRQVAGKDKAEPREREVLRRAFRPAAVRLLFIGESPPASGRFFYCRNSGLYRAMRDAFRRVDPAIDDENFLGAFQASGCYLIDLCGSPVDHLDSKSRKIACQAGEESLSKTIAELQPPTIATLVRSIEPNVLRAASRVGWNGLFLHLPYPGRWSRHREAFWEALTPAVRGLLPDRQSDRKACNTSTRAARSAGRTDAIIAAAISTTADPISTAAPGIRIASK
jgi:hypothetical protein